MAPERSAGRVALALVPPDVRRPRAAPAPEALVRMAPTLAGAAIPAASPVATAAVAILAGQRRLGRRRNALPDECDRRHRHDQRDDRAQTCGKNGTASCRESVCQYVQLEMVAVSLQKKKEQNNRKHPK